MALPSTGAISLNNVNQELGKASPYNQVVSLNDADVRTLFGIASGAIRMSDGYGKTLYSNSVTFNYTASSTSWTVPAGVTSIKVRLWGGGGGTGLAANMTTVIPGGGGGFMEGIISVTPGQTINIYTGGGGIDNVDDTCECDPDNDYVTRVANNFGTGGEKSIVSVGGWATTTNSLDYIISGGGGGGSSGAGGAGGGSTGGSGGSFSTQTGGTGGITGEVGAGAGGTGFSSGSLWQNKTYIYNNTGASTNRGNGTFYCDFDSATPSAGGYGGDGFAGGGSGNAAANDIGCGGLPYGAGGGGGSSGYGRGGGYVNTPIGNGSGWTGVTNTQASGGTAAATGNADYTAGIANSQSNGKIVIRY